MDQVFTSCGSRRRLLIASIIAAFACSAAPISRAQEVALPEASPTTTPDVAAALSAATTTTPTPAPTVPPPQLIPPDILPMPDPSAPPTTVPAGPTLEQLDEVLKPKSLSRAAEDYRLAIEWRKLRNQAQNNPKVKAAYATAERARTDLEKRRFLADYFNVLFDTEIALGAPEMKNYLNDRRREHLNGLPQRRVRPDGVPEAKAKPTPAPSVAPVAPPPTPDLPEGSPSVAPPPEER